MSEEQKPTETGKEQWPFNGYYDSLPCTCNPKCDDPCDGHTCGCKACERAWSDYLSGPDS